jgi:hypothetical protein
MLHFRSGLPLLAALLLPEPGSSQAGAESCTPAVPDHVPIAVRSLDVAESTYERLGFRLKRGRVHANGLRNAFVKFPGGDYLELISPERGATDDLSERYAAHLDAGEGGSALALRVDSLRALGRRLEAAPLPVEIQTYGSAFTTLSFPDAELRWLFLIEYHSPVVDEPELLAHPNTAAGIETVWLTEEALAALPTIAGSLCLPAVRRATGATPAARVAGVTLRVRSVDVLHRLLRTAGLDVPMNVDARGRTVFLPAEKAHGIFIEFRESDPGGGS